MKNSFHKKYILAERESSIDSGKLCVGCFRSIQCAFDLSMSGIGNWILTGFVILLLRVSTAITSSIGREHGGVGSQWKMSSLATPELEVFYETGVYIRDHEVFVSLSLLPLERMPWIYKR